MSLRNSLDIDKPPAATRIVVAMSGGVDSSVVAASLKADGFDVVGITLKLYDDNNRRSRPGSCCAGRDIADARAVADRIGIPHYTLDYEARFRASVIEPFAVSYARGETPIPCASCNNSVKFTDLLATARDLGADALATGHYCTTRALPGGGRGLFRAADPARDQSYFLFGTTRDQLAFVRFPLGTLLKPDVRALARRFGLGNADKPDSQDICFVPDGRYSDLVSRLLPEVERAGDIVDMSGTVLGRHNGTTHFTIGQRRGLNLGGHDAPLYVTAIDARRARVVVGPASALETTTLTLRDINWLGDGDGPPRSFNCSVQTRSTRRPVPASVSLVAGGAATVSFAATDRLVAPGQACVFYDGADDGARVLGGGTVTRDAALDPDRVAVLEDCAL